jgi:hypothetical protein
VAIEGALVTVVRNDISKHFFQQKVFDFVYMCGKEEIKYVQLVRKKTSANLLI